MGGRKLHLFILLIVLLSIGMGEAEPRLGRRNKKRQGILSAIAGTVVAAGVGKMIKGARATPMTTPPPMPPQFNPFEGMNMNSSQFNPFAGMNMNSSQFNPFAGMNMNSSQFNPFAGMNRNSSDPNQEGFEAFATAMLGAIQLSQALQGQNGSMPYPPEGYPQSPDSAWGNSGYPPHPSQGFPGQFPPPPPDTHNQIPPQRVTVQHVTPVTTPSPAPKKGSKNSASTLNFSIGYICILAIVGQRIATGNSF